MSFYVKLLWDSISPFSWLLFQKTFIIFDFGVRCFFILSKNYLEKWDKYTNRGWISSQWIVLITFTLPWHVYMFALTCHPQHPCMKSAWTCWRPWYSMWDTCVSRTGFPVFYLQTVRRVVMKAWPYVTQHLLDVLRLQIYQSYKIRWSDLMGEPKSEPNCHVLCCRAATLPSLHIIKLIAQTCMDSSAPLGFEPKFSLLSLLSVFGLKVHSTLSNLF